MKEVLALSWFEHRRMRELCAGLEVELVVLSTHQSGLARYLSLTVRTILLLARRQPHILVVQNPSLVLAALCIVFRRMFSYRIIVDAHNEAVVPFINRQPWVKALSHWILRRSDLTLVTNAQLADIVRQQGGTPFELPDRIPDPPRSIPRPLSGGFNVVLISTFAPDEPLTAVLEAVRGSELNLYVTGNHKKLGRVLAASVPENVTFTGFLAEDSYWGLLEAADAIVDLTMMPSCLVCGAYEALALGKPMVLSDDPAGVHLFGRAAVFTDNSPADIRRALQTVRDQRTQLQAAAVQRRDELRDAWIGQARKLSTAIADWTAQTDAE
jgi:glycosyltransferase involved in cell wall biosynthesis